MALEDPNKKVPEPVLEPGEVETLDDDYYPDDFYDDYDDFYIEDSLCDGEFNHDDRED